MNTRYTVSAAIGRVSIATLFLLSGLGKLAAPVATQGVIASAGLPAPLLSYIGATAIEIIGAIFLIVGYRTRSAAAVLAIFTLLAAIAFHSNFADQNQLIHFFKNLAIAGGLLQVLAFGAGSFSLDARRAPRLARVEGSAAPLAA